MSILIKGADMPEKCGQCSCFHHEFPMYCQATKESNNKIPDAPYGMPRPDWCPLVEVPTPHGRLIDADALEHDAQKRLLMCDKNDNQFQKPYEVLRAIALAPTIIEAEDGE